MNENRIRDAFETMNTTKEMDRRILEAVHSGQETQKGRPRRRSRRFYHRLALAAAIVLTLFTVFQIPQVATYAETIVKTFTNVFRVQGEEIKTEGKFLELDEDAGNEMEKFDTLRQVEKKINIKLLKYDQGYEKNLAWQYSPWTDYSEGIPDDEIFGVTITNDYYILGDLKNVKINSHQEASTVNSIIYEKGKNFGTPIKCQIIIYTSAFYEARDGDGGMENGILDYDSIINQETATTYQCKNLDTEVILYEIVTDGPAAWEQVEGFPVTFMILSYDGITYEFCGQVSKDTMKEIAENLHY